MIHSKIKRSKMDKANKTGILDSYNSKYLINYFIMGENMTEPENWDDILGSVDLNLGLSNFSGGHTFNKEVAQKCYDEMFLAAKWRNDETGELVVFDHSTVFTSSYTDYGVCCKIFPQLDFENPDTRNISVSDYKSKSTSFKSNELI